MEERIVLVGKRTIRPAPKGRNSKKKLKEGRHLRGVVYLPYKYVGRRVLVVIKK